PVDDVVDWFFQTAGPPQDASRVVAETNGSIHNRYGGSNGQPCLRGARALDRGDPCRHQHRRDDHRGPLRLITKVIFVMRIPRLKATEERGNDCCDGHLPMKTAFSHVLHPADWFMFPTDGCGPVMRVRRPGQDSVGGPLGAAKQGSEKTEVSTDAKQE